MVISGKSIFLVGKTSDHEGFSWNSPQFCEIFPSMVGVFCDDHHLAKAPGKHNNTELEMPPKGKGKTCTNRKFGGFHINFRRCSNCLKATRRIWFEGYVRLMGKFKLANDCSQGAKQR